MTTKPHTFPTMQPHLLYFPCRGQVFDYFSDLTNSGKPPVTTELLSEQRRFERDPTNGPNSRITCHSCGESRARFIVCLLKGENGDLLYPRRFPHTKHLHKPECYSYHQELLEATGENVLSSPVVAARGDFSALWQEQSDPEFRALPSTRAKHERSQRSHPLDGRIRRTNATVSLRRFASEVLQRAGVCDWHPHYQGSRDERAFNGLVLGAISALAATESQGKSAALLKSLPPETQIIPWSFLDERRPKIPQGMRKCVGFGFINHIGPANQHGARAMTLSNLVDQPILVPVSVLAEEADDTRSPFHPLSALKLTWVMFVAERYEGIWKVHHLAWFRLSEVGLIPIESRYEEMMIELLIGERRSFRRWLMTPPELRGTKWVPDLQLIVKGQFGEYIEVAGRMDDPEYADNIRRKQEKLGSRLLVWDTRLPLREFILPLPVAPSNRLPRPFPGSGHYGCQG